jgi:diguanylate cyclase (GGDEF)-like protein/PAS domain S-box-containing protein
LTELIVQQLDYLYFVCGLAYCILAYAAFSIKAKQGSTMPWRWMGLFALLQCLSAWTSVIALLNWWEWVNVLQVALGCAGLASLVEFGRRVSGWDKLEWRGLWIYALLLAPAITVAFYDYHYIGVSLKALLAAGVIIMVLPGLLKTPRSRELGLKPELVAGCVLLTGLVIINPFATFLFDMLPQFTNSNFDTTVWLELLLLLETIIAVLLAMIGRKIYDAVREQYLGPGVVKPRHKWLIGLALAGIVTAGFVITLFLTSAWQKELNQVFITQAKIAAMAVDAQQVENMTGADIDLATSDFQRLYEQQRMINKANPLNRWTYLLIQRQGRIITLTDSDPATSSEHTVMAEYKDAPPEITAVFAWGHPTVIGPYVDNWGTWITALAPITNSRTFQVVGVQGVDIAADTIRNLLATKRLEAICSIWLFAMFALGYYYYERRLREQLALVRQSENRYSAIVENALDGIMIIQGGKIIFVNESAGRILGRTVSESTGYTFTDFIHEDDRATLKQRYEDRMAGRPVTPTVPLRIARPDGEIRHVEATGTVIDYEGEPADMAQIRDITERRLAEDAVHKAHNKLEVIIDSLPDATFVIDHERNIIAWNKAMVSLTGFTKEQMLGKGNYEYALPLYGKRRPVFIDMVFTDENKTMQHYDNVHREGDRAYAETFVPGVLSGKGAYMWGTASLLRDENGNIMGAIETIRDITYRKDLEQELQASNEKLKEWLGQAETRAQDIVLIGEMVQWIDSCDSIKEATKIAGHYLEQLFQGDDGFLAFVNLDCNNLEAECIFGRPAGDLFFSNDECWGIRLGKLHSCDWKDNCQVCRHLGDGYKGTYIEIPLIAQGHPLGLICIQHAATAGIDSKESAAWLTAKKEIAARTAEPLSLALANTKLRATLREQANRDPLTGLHNRRYMEEALERELHRAGREQRGIGFIMGDIDHFKDFNDRYGHEAGDLMLKAVANTIKSSIRAEDIACRFGGEEFLIILPSASLSGTVERARQIHDDIRKICFDCNGNHISNVSISIGISSYPEYGSSNSALISAADMAMYNAKREGRDRVCLPV